MSHGLNRASLLGNLGEAPDLRKTNSGTSVLKLRMATTESVPQDDGTRKDFTQWHNVVVWGKRADGLAPLLAKGSRIYVEGRIETRSYDKDGEKRWVTEISAQNVILLDGRKPDESSGDHSNAAPPAGAQQPQSQPQVRDIPF